MNGALFADGVKSDASNKAVAVEVMNRISYSPKRW